MAELVSWDTAAAVAAWVASRYEPLTYYEQRSLEDDFAEFTARAEALVEEETGLRSLDGPARARVADRTQWTQANVASLQRLMRPLIDKLEARAGGGGILSSLPTQVSRHVAGAEVGALLGWMSTRVLGQYDQLLIEDENPDDQDIVYYVGPNVISVERRYGFPPREFRLWLALHEVTHRAQFTGVPWMRAHFLSLVERTVGGFDADARKILEAFRRNVSAIRSGHNPLDDGGLVSLIAGPEQFEAIQEVAALMSLLEGHGDVTMNRAGEGVVPSAPRFAATLSQRRRLKGPAKAMSVLVGFDAKLRQYEQGERFIGQVESAGGSELFAKVWNGPEWLPSWSEIRSPSEWVRRASEIPATAP